MSILGAVESLPPLLLAILMVAAAVGDTRRYIIPNSISLAVAGCWLLFIALELALGDSTRIYTDVWRQVWTSGLIAGFVFMLSAGLFAIGVMGGGDVKLLAAVALWAGPQLAVMFLFVTASAGGIVSLAILLREKARPKAAASPIVNSFPPMITKPKVPYGLGIAAGGLYVAWELATRTGLWM